MMKLTFFDHKISKILMVKRDGKKKYFFLNSTSEHHKNKEQGQKPARFK